MSRVKFVKFWSVIYFMNSRKSLYDVNSFYNKKAVLKASFKGMRYQVEKVEDEENSARLRATVWSEPFCFEKTPDNYKQTKEFACEESGLDDAYNWICERYDSDKDKWEHAMRFPLDTAKAMGII